MRLFTEGFLVLFWGLVWGFFLFFSCFKSSILAKSEAATTQKPTSIGARKYTSMQNLTFVQLYKDCNITATAGR